METIDKQATNSTPAICFDPDTHILRISGESYPENSFDFYAPVIVWLKVNLPELAEFTLDISVNYMNSSSTKCILDIMDIMETAYNRGVITRIIWRYDHDNPRSYDMAEDFSEEVTFPFAIEALGS